MNGFFGLIIEDKGTSIRLYPPTNGGDPVSINEVMQYLQMQKIIYDTIAIGKALREHSATVDVLLTPDRIYPVHEMFSITLNDDRTKAICRFYPPSSYGKLMGKDEIQKDLINRKVIFGIDEKAIEEYTIHRQYCTNLVLAQGVPARHGNDGIIKFFFNTDVKAKPTVNEDGSVDFFHLNTLNQCKIGDVIAEMVPEDIGEPGISVYKEKLNCREVKKVRFSYSNNIQLSEDGLKLISMVNGHVTYVNGKVFVSNLLEVENVDNSTGNIDYEGSVKINGNVLSNFTVRSKGNVEVKGVVEGAFIYAEGDIIITRGMNGMNKGSLKAGGNIIAKFLENATAEAGGYIQTDSILHCNVMSRTEVIVTSNKGYITGGKVSATNAVSVRTLGSNMGADTVVEIGVDPSVKQKYQLTQKSLVEAATKLKQIEPVLIALTTKLKNGANMHADQMKYIQAMAVERKELKEKIEENQKILSELQEVIDASSNAQVTILGEVYPGTKIVIADVSMVIKKTTPYCRFVKRQGEVQMISI